MTPTSATATGFQIGRMVAHAPTCLDDHEQRALHQAIADRPHFLAWIAQHRDRIEALGDVGARPLYGLAVTDTLWLVAEIPGDLDHPETLGTITVLDLIERAVIEALRTSRDVLGSPENPDDADNPLLETTAIFPSIHNASTDDYRIERGAAVVESMLDESDRRILRRVIADRHRFLSWIDQNRDRLELLDEQQSLYGLRITDTLQLIAEISGNLNQPETIGPIKIVDLMNRLAIQTIRGEAETPV